MVSTLNPSNQVDEIAKLLESVMAMGQNFWRDMGANREEGLGSSDLNFDFTANGDQADDDKYINYKTWSGVSH